MHYTFKNHWYVQITTRIGVAMEEFKEIVEGGCTCGHVRYTLESLPLITHCCHCRYCQCQTGTAFALNALFDSRKVNVICGNVEIINTPSPSGRGQNISRCPKCHVAVWSSYFMGGIKDLIKFIRVGTLDNPDLFPPDVHIYTESKQPWVNLPDHSIVHEKFYDFKTTWTTENNALRKTLLSMSTKE